MLEILLKRHLIQSLLVSHQKKTAYKVFVIDQNKVMKIVYVTFDDSKGLYLKKMIKMDEQVGTIGPSWDWFSLFGTPGTIDYLWDWFGLFGSLGTLAPLGI